MFNIIPVDAQGVDRLQETECGVYLCLDRFNRSGIVAFDLSDQDYVLDTVSSVIAEAVYRFIKYGYVGSKGIVTSAAESP